MSDHRPARTEQQEAEAVSARQRADQQRYALLYVAQQDLVQARNFAAHLIKNGWHYEPWERHSSTYIQQSAFATALVVAYCRPFTVARGWPKFPTSLLAHTPDEKALHVRLDGLRNAVYAHSDVEARVIRPIKIGPFPSAIEAYPAMRITKAECEMLMQMIDKTTAAIKASLVELADSVA